MAATSSETEALTKLENWPELPKDCMSAVVEYLGCNDRRMLRQCSTVERKIADETPVFISRAIFGYVQREFYFCSDDGYVTTRELPSSVRNIDVDEEDEYIEDEKDVVHKFLQFFKPSMPFVKEITFEVPQNPIIPMLVSTATARKIKIRAEKVFIKCAMNTDQLVIDLLKLIHARALKHLDMDLVTQDIFNKVIETDQWKKCQSMELQEVHTAGTEHYRISELDIECLFHAQKILLRLHEIPVNSVWKLIQNFQARKLPVGSNFIIWMGKEADYLYLKVQPTLKKQWKNEPMGKDYGFHHTQRFPMAESDKVLVLGIGKRCYIAIVCRRDFVDEDYQSFYKCAPFV